MSANLATVIDNTVISSEVSQILQSSKLTVCQAQARQAFTEAYQSALSEAQDTGRKAGKRAAVKALLAGIPVKGTPDELHAWVQSSQ